MILATITACTIFLIRFFFNKPIRQLIEVAETYGTGSGSPPERESTFSEFQPLLDVLGRMEQRISQQFAELSESEEKYRQLFDVEPDALFFVDTETLGILDANDAVSRMYGYTREELLLMHFSDLSVNGDRTKPKETKGRAQIELGFHRRKDGSTFPVEINTVTFEWKGRRMQFDAIRDITERRRSEAERQRLLAIIESTNDFISTSTPDEHINYINSAGLRLIGLSQDEGLSIQSIQDLHPEWAFDLIQEVGLPTAARKGIW